MVGLVKTNWKAVGMSKTVDAILREIEVDEAVDAPVYR
jgi:hypothetical protein